MVEPQSSLRAATARMPDEGGTRTHRERWEQRLRAFEAERYRTTWRTVLARMGSNKLLLIGSVLAGLVLLVAVFGPILSDASPTAQDLRATHLPPLSEGHLLGTDGLGRDIAIRLFIGIRISLLVAAGVTALALGFGVVIGLVAGYAGGWTDRGIRGAVDFVWGFPLILVAVLMVSILGQGLVPVILAVGLVNTAAIARVVRGEVLTLKQREFIEAARAGGFTTFRIMWRHVVPNILAPALVLASYYVSVAIIAEAALSFIGLGAQPPTPSLGQMVAEGRNVLRLNHWEATIPGLTIATLVLSVSLIGDGLRDVFDPRLRHEAKGV